MNARCLPKNMFLAIAVAVVTILPASAENKEKPSTGEIPSAVMKTLKTKFPKAEIDKWTKEKEGDVEVYDIEFRQEGRKFEADIKADGSIHNWERAIGAVDLPPPVNIAVREKYPNCLMKEVMVITAVVKGVDKLEGYEIVLDTAEGKEVELTVAENGAILEEKAGGE